LQYLTFFASHATVMLANALKDSRMRSINMGVITSFVRAVEAKDHYTSGHSERVSSYAVMLGRKMGLASKDLKLLRIAGLLHDIGKIGVPDHILNKPGPLTSQEYAVMKRHAEVGQDIVRRVIFLEEVLPLIYCHHERPDGLGYPEGLPLGDIPPLSRIISVVDGHEAMTSDRAYRQGMTYRDAMERLRRGAGSQWDERMVHTWLEIASSPSFSEEARKAAMAE
jgi:putative nucleotidyltransferase with HDIG domain